LGAGQLTKPKFFRDPVHLQLRFENVPLDSDPSTLDAVSRRSWLLRKIIDDPEFQRLRSIRQNALTNLVFHGAEHSRFTHSLGVSHLAGVMYRKIVRNCSEAVDEDVQSLVMAAALLHDVGHGPFSHALEEIIREAGHDFHHEDMTIRFITDPSSTINKVLQEYDKAAPSTLEKFFDESKRDDNNWTYRIVSSQIDADRLDYLQRDTLFSGVRGVGFDIERILDLMYHSNNKKSIAVEIGALEAAESYLFTLDHMYRTVYYHHSVRAATRTMTSLVRRAVQLFREGDKSIFPSLIAGQESMLAELVMAGNKIDIGKYSRLGDFTLWQHFDVWRESEDKLLADLAERVVNRRLFKAIEVSYTSFEKVSALVTKARALALQAVPGLTDALVDLYVVHDEPDRTGYKTYTWKPESAEESIWLVGDKMEPHPIETHTDSRVIEGLKSARVFPRLIVPEEVRAQL
jgi:HD superfamily phosphohydrolase